ncbi:unnamed protein product [Eruca vesicaria subsp. sativa]|uniref:AP2/ERF domain-containing protein n=1 Tax=Eruca vesicaria subsp. sativa TaxID=29727 RepID=A0ABC8ISN5_ERUVS|nr:unnamed protein product [Eruca vesicaria subsp. sativa]
MMLDLNLDVATPELTMMDESVTSNSSLINAEASSCIDGEEEELCSTRAVKFQFEILKGGEKEDRSDVMMMTKEFFPVSSNSKRGDDAVTVRVMQPPAQPVKKSRRGPRSKSSQYRGVTFYRRTGRWESHIWDCGKQVYLDGCSLTFNVCLCRAYDRAAVKFRGLEADINFIISDYEEDLKQMANLSKEEVVQLLRRQSSGFSRNNSRYQEVAMQKIGGWGAQMNQFSGNMAYNKTATKWSGREVASLIEPHASRMIPESANVKLDLSLGNSLSRGDSPKQTERAPWLHHAPNSILCGRNSMVENHMAAATCDTPFNLLKRGSEHLINRHDHPPAFFSPMERAPEKVFMSASPPQSFPARTWKTQDATTAIASPLYSNAASSGFSLSATRPPSSSTATTHHPSQPFLNLNMPSLYVIHPSDHVSQQHHHHLMNRSQPPP